MLDLLQRMPSPPTGALPKKGRFISYTCKGACSVWLVRGVGVCWGSGPAALWGVCPATGSLLYLAGTMLLVVSLDTSAPSITVSESNTHTHRHFCLLVHASVRLSVQ